MVWLFACFGCTKKRKRPRKASKFGSKCTRIRSYQLLESESNVTYSHEHTITDPNLKLRDETKDEKKVRITKKVRFNLEVIAYEPIPKDDGGTNSDEDEIDNNWQEIETDEDEQSASKVNVVYAASHASLANHRYSNCYEQDDEDDEDEECELSDLDDEDDNGDYHGNDEWMVDPRKIYHEEIAEEHHKYCLAMHTPEDDLGVSDISTKNTRFRSHYVVPVLNPIENLSQWKALKEENKNP